MNKLQKWDASERVTLLGTWLYLSSVSGTMLELGMLNLRHA